MRGPALHLDTSGPLQASACASALQHAFQRIELENIRRPGVAANALAAAMPRAQHDRGFACVVFTGFGNHAGAQRVRSETVRVFASPQAIA